MGIIKQLPLISRSSKATQTVYHIVRKIKVRTKSNEEQAQELCDALNKESTDGSIYIVEPEVDEIADTGN